MESSTVLAFRIFVMLACLIIVPMAAIFGSAFPDVVKSMLVDRIVAWSTGESPEPTAAAAGDGFREVTAGTAVAAATQAPPFGTPARDPGSWRAAGERATPDHGVVPLGQAAAGGFNQSASFAAPANLPPSQPPANQLAASPYHRAPAAQSGGPAPTVAPTGNSPYAARPASGGGAAQRDPFSQMEHKLREYGATYYLLETWGNDGQLYRFHCRMAVGGDPNYTRHFEATDRDALAAMSEVLRQVEAWRSGQAQQPAAR